MMKINQRFVLSDESVNKQGFRVITSGIDLEQFRKNPVMLWMHFRATGSSVHEVLPLGYWADIEIINNALTAIPVFDDSDTFAMNIANKVKSGTIKMASAGLNPVEWSSDEKMKVQGQSQNTLLKSILVEASIVDIGANNKALSAALFDSSGATLSLSDISKEIEIVKGNPKDVLLMLSNAFNDGKISTDEMAILKGAALNDFKTVKSLIDKRQPGYSLTQSLISKNYKELDKNGGLSTLKKYLPMVYKQKFFEEFGKHPQ